MIIDKKYSARVCEANFVDLEKSMDKFWGTVVK